MYNTTISNRRNVTVISFSNYSSKRKIKHSYTGKHTDHKENVISHHQRHNSQGMIAPENRGELRSHALDENLNEA